MISNATGSVGAGLVSRGYSQRRLPLLLFAGVEAKGRFIKASRLPICGCRRFGRRNSGRCFDVDRIGIERAADSLAQGCGSDKFSLSCSLRFRAWPTPNVPRMTQRSNLEGSTIRSCAFPWGALTFAGHCRRHWVLHRRARNALVVVLFRFPFCVSVDVVRNYDRRCRSRKIPPTAQGECSPFAQRCTCSTPLDLEITTALMVGRDGSPSTEPLDRNPSRDTLVFSKKPEGPGRRPKLR